MSCRSGRFVDLQRQVYRGSNGYRYGLPERAKDLGPVFVKGFISKRGIAS